MAARKAEATLLGQIAAQERWRRTPGKAERQAATQPARDGLEARFARVADPDGTLTPDELEAAIAAARSAHYTRLALLSARSRQALAAARKAAGDVTAARRAERAGRSILRATDELRALIDVR